MEHIQNIQQSVWALSNAPRAEQAPLLQTLCAVHQLLQNLWAEQEQAARRNEEEVSRR